MARSSATMPAGRLRASTETRGMGGMACGPSSTRSMASKPRYSVARMARMAMVSMSAPKTTTTPNSSHVLSV